MVKVEFFEADSLERIEEMVNEFLGESEPCGDDREFVSISIDTRMKEDCDGDENAVYTAALAYKD